MAAAYSSPTFSLVPRSSSLHFTLPSPSFLSPQQLVTFHTLSFNSTVTNNPSPLRVRVLSMRQSRASEVSRQSWNTSILKSETPVLVEFYASWCGPCQMVHRVIDEIATEYDGKLKCFVLNADQDLAVAEEYEIKAVPVVLLFKNGEKCESVVGTMPKEFYVAAIERVLAS